MSTIKDISSEFCAQRPQLQGIVTVQAIWSGVALVWPKSELLVWLAMPLAILFAMFAQRTNRGRTPTVANITMSYLNMTLAEAGFSHWALGAPEVLRAKLAVLTIMGLGAAVMEIWAWLGEILDLRERVLHPRQPTPARTRPVKPHRRRKPRKIVPARPAGPRPKPRKRTNANKKSTRRRQPRA